MGVGFKKFLGVMSVSVILGGCSGAGYGAADDVSSVSKTGIVPVMTEEEVEFMDAMTSYVFMVRKMLDDDCSVWDKEYAGKAKSLVQPLKKCDLRFFAVNSGKRGRWKRADDMINTINSLIDSGFVSDKEMRGWLDKYGLPY